ncbi:MAG: hypothetical protein AAF797_06515 [Planctomycetota bacterium]
MLCLTSCATAFGLAPVTAEDVLYRETFPNATGSGKALIDYGWRYHLGPEGWNEKDNGATQGLVNENRGTSPQDKPVASGSTDRSDRGFVVNGLGPNGENDNDYWNQITHYVTDEFTLDLKQTELTAFTFDLALSQPDAVRVTAKVDGRWYASKQTFTSPPIPDYGIYAAFHRLAKRHTLDPRGVVWLPLGFTPNVSLGLDTSLPATALPQGQLQAFGLLLKPTGFEAFDTFTLRGKPRAN